MCFSMFTSNNYKIIVTANYLIIYSIILFRSLKLFYPVDIFFKLNFMVSEKFLSFFSPFNSRFIFPKIGHFLARFTFLIQQMHGTQYSADCSRCANFGTHLLYFSQCLEQSIFTCICGFWLGASVARFYYLFQLRYNKKKKCQWPKGHLV